MIPQSISEEFATSIVLPIEILLLRKSTRHSCVALSGMNGNFSAILLRRNMLIGLSVGLSLWLLAIIATATCIVVPGLLRKVEIAKGIKEE